VMMGTNGMVAAEHPLEALAGFDVLRNGGNAIDAAVATFYMTTVVEQHQAGIGGDAFLLAYIAKEKRVVFLNGTGPAPKLATREAYLKLGGIPESGPYASEVPGAVGGFDLALKKYGTRQYDVLLREAIRAAAQGHPLSHWSASNYVEAVAKISKYPSSLRVLLKNGKPFEPGDLLVQADLARTLRTIAAEGANSFYHGSLARLTADFYQKQGGLLRFEDLSAYQAEEAEPISTIYKGYQVIQCPPNSQGIVLLMALNLVEGFDLPKLGHNSPDYLHVVTEALKLAFADRDRYVSDPRFAKEIPTQGLLSKQYAAKRRALIRMDRAIKGLAPPGDPRNGAPILAGHKIAYEEGPQSVQPAPTSNGDQGETSSFSIADRWGNVVSVTHSVNGTFGSGMVVEGGGYVLNNRMPYFYLDPEHVNVLMPGKRTLHTINPALAMKDGKPFLAWNTPGGDNQPQAMLQAFLNVVEFGLNVQQAVEAPTITTSSFYPTMFPHKPGDKLTVPTVLADRIGAALAARGHRLQVVPLQQPYKQQPSGAGAVKMILFDSKTGMMYGGVSPAKDDYVMGW
ncbi:MAG: gamma-glutamyltransferase, partial [Acidobacteria bacterium]|nr:gamma-glutamyltransferase [Acidobacteriota bacterium]